MTQAKGTLKRKLTIKEIMGGTVSDIQEVKNMLAAGLTNSNPQPVVLCRIAGLLTKAKPGVSKTNDKEFVLFSGEIVGINVLTGEQLAAGSVILPGAAESMLYGAMGALDDRGQGAQVEFALEISVRYESTAVTKYVYDVRSLVEHKASSPMTALLQKAGLAQLEAPKADAAPAATNTAKPEGGRGKK